MTRRKKPVHYMNELCSNPNHEIRNFGKLLKQEYKQWTTSLYLKDMLRFIRAIQTHKDKIGGAQLFGKFRAYVLEEYVYRLIQAKVFIPKPLELYWGEKCLILEKDRFKYGVEMDVTIGKPYHGLVKPQVVVDAKVELDACRLKTTLASFVLLKQAQPNIKCFLVYIKREVHPKLLKLAKPWIDGLYEFTMEKDETSTFISTVQKALEKH